MRIQPSYNQSFICPYSFQAQEHDDELKGDGNSVNYKYRMHDPRLGRFFAVDPLASQYPYYSSYQFSGNRPIDCIELEGLEPRMSTKGRLRISERSHSDGTGNSRIGLHLYPRWKRSGASPAPSPKDCFEYKTIDVPTKIRTVVTERIVANPAGEENKIADLGTTESTIGKNVSGSYGGTGAHTVYWDPHGDAEKITITNSTSGEIIQIIDGTTAQPVHIPCGVSFDIKIEGKGTYTCDVFEISNTLITTTSIYIDGVLASKNSTSTPTVNCPSEMKVVSDEMSDGSKKKKVKVPCSENSENNEDEGKKDKPAVKPDNSDE